MALPLSSLFQGPTKVDVIDNGTYAKIPEVDGDVDTVYESSSSSVYDSKLKHDGSNSLNNPRDNCDHYLNPYRMNNIGMFISYFDVGIAMNLLTAPVAYYLINDLNASSSQYSAYSTLVNLPWSLKFVFGLISDTNPIFGYRRKSWLTISWLLYVVINYFLVLRHEPSITLITMLMFMMVCCVLQADVCTDTVFIERARFESIQDKGSLQTSGYTVRAAGSFFGAVLGAVLFNKSTWGWGLTIQEIFTLSGLVPIVGVLLFVWSFEEIQTKTARIPNAYESLQDIFQTLQLKAVWKPMMFIIPYYILQTPNNAWTSFLLKGLHFSDFELGVVTMSQQLFIFLGFLAYKKYFFETSWRKIYIYTTGIAALFSVLQLTLIYRWNRIVGIPDVLFALGDSGVFYFVQAIQSMPSSIMFLTLCPEGSEGITYALLTTIGNLAWIMSNVLATLLTRVWDVSNEALEKQDFTGMANLTILTSFIQLTPLVLVFLLPDSKQSQLELKESQERSVTAAILLTIFILLGLASSVIINLLYV